LNLFQTILFVLLCFVAVSLAIPAPGPIPKDFKRETPDKVEDDLKGGEEEKDLKGAESIYHGYYAGYPYYPYK
jgi:hypothetical protein